MDQSGDNHLLLRASQSALLPTTGSVAPLTGSIKTIQNGR